MDDPQYRPARSKDFERAVHGIDTSDIQTSPTHGTMGTAPGVPPYDETTPVAHRADDRTTTTTPLGHRADDRTTLAEAGAYGATPAYGMGAREERVTERVDERETVARNPQPFSIAAGFFGWAVASFFTLVLATLALALLGAAAYDATDAGAVGVTQETFNALTTGGLVALLVSLFVAYLLGGYVAGRIGLWHGIGHGVAVVGWSVLFTVLTLALSAWLGDAVAGLNLVPAIDWTALTGPAIVGLVLTLLTMLAGAILGAKLGTRPYGIDGVHGRSARPLRGRPL